MAASARPPYKKCPSDTMPIQPTKYAHPTYEKCPSDLQIKCPSDLQNWVAIRQLQLIISIILSYRDDKLLNRSDGQEDMPIRTTAVVGQMLE